MEVKNNKKRKLYVYSNYSNTVILIANSMFEAYGLIMSIKNENGNNKYYCDINDIKEIQGVDVMYDNNFEIIETNKL